MVDFNAILATQCDDIKEPKYAPEGAYGGVITKYEFIESAQKKTPGVKFFVSLTEAVDVDETALAEAEGLDGKKVSFVLYLYEPLNDSKYKLLVFLRDVIGITTEGRSLTDSLADVLNMPVGIVLKTIESSKTPGTFVTVFDRTFKYPE